MKNERQEIISPSVFSPVDISKATIDDVENKVLIATFLNPLAKRRGLRNVALVMDRMGSNATLEEVGKDYGITKERVRVIVANSRKTIALEWILGEIKAQTKLEEKEKEIRSMQESAQSLPLPKITRVA